MKKLLFSALLLVVISSCRKKNTEPSTEASAPTVNKSPETGTLTPSTGGDFCDLKTYYGYVEYHGAISVDSTVWARFFKDTGSTASNVFAGQVTLNGHSLVFDTTSNSYLSVPGMYLNISSNLAWSVSGSGTVTAFTQSYTPLYPRYADASQLPDTCSKTSGIVIPVSGISNHTGGAAVKILSSTQSTQYKYISGSAGTCTFSPQDLAAFSINAPITIYISIDNNYSATIGGIKRGFSNSLYYKKVAYLKP